MAGDHRTGLRLVLACAVVAQAAVGLRAEVNLEWRPLLQGASVDDLVDIRLYAVSDSGFDQNFGGLDVVFTWDPAQLELFGHFNPCMQEPCPPDTYLWLQSWFPDDSQLDGINDDLDDGDALFQVLAQLGGGDVLPLATPQGLWVTSLRFRVLNSGITEVVMVDEIGSTRTRVAGGLFPGVEVTGELGPPSEVVSVPCLSPVSLTVGCRYLSITPQFSEMPVALLVQGSQSDPDVSCVSRYVQSDGSLGVIPHYQLPGDWGTVVVTGEVIVPSAVYSVYADCVESVPGFFLSSPSPTATWRWGDTDGNGSVTFNDLSSIADAAFGSLPPGFELSQLDIAPCVPDGVVDQKDVDAVIEAVANHAYPCIEPCAIVTMDDLPMFAACLEGPSMSALPDCLELDFNGDAHVDLLDAATFQRFFAMGELAPAVEPTPAIPR